MIKLFILIAKVVFEETIKYFVVLSLAQWIKEYFSKNKQEKIEAHMQLKRILILIGQLFLVFGATAVIVGSSYYVGKITERKMWCEKYDSVPCLMPKICKDNQNIILENKNAESNKK